MGGLITALGCTPYGPKVSDTRIQANTYLFFQDTARNVSEVYPGRIRIRYVSDTDTPPPRSIRVTESYNSLIVSMWDVINLLEPYVSLLDAK